MYPERIEVGLPRRGVKLPRKRKKYCQSAPRAWTAARGHNCYQFHEYSVEPTFAASPELEVVGEERVTLATGVREVILLTIGPLPRRNCPVSFRDLWGGQFKTPEHMMIGPERIGKDAYIVAIALGPTCPQRTDLRGWKDVG